MLQVARACTRPAVARCASLLAALPAQRARCGRITGPAPRAAQHGVGRPITTTPQTPPPKEGGLRISHLFMGLVGLGLLATTYGLLEWYYSLQIWPEPVRTPLKKALKAKMQGDIEKAEKYFAEAIEAAKSITPAQLGDDPLQRLSGIYISLASMLETSGQPVKAFVALRESYALFGPSPLAATPEPAKGWYDGALAEEDVTRAIGLAQKLGQIAARMGGMAAPPTFPTAESAQMVLSQPSGPSANVLAAAKPRSDSDAGLEWDRAAETYLSAAVTAMLRLGLRPVNGATAQEPAKATPQQVVVGRDVHLPHEGEPEGRVNRRGLGMTMEALAEVYGRRGRSDLAGHLLLQAISTLIPPQASQPPVADRCQAATLMTALSSHALAPGTERAKKAAQSWSNRALDIIEAAVEENGWKGTPTTPEHATCARAMSAAQYNLGMLEEIAGKPKAAAQWFAAAQQTARVAGFAEGKREAAEALRRVRGGGD